MGEQQSHALGQLHYIHVLTKQLLESVAARETHLHHHPELKSLAWYSGHMVYLELSLIREKILHYNKMVERVSNESPSGDHCNNWALGTFAHCLILLANPGIMPLHFWLKNIWIVGWLVQHYSEIYELMLKLLHQCALNIASQGNYLISDSLVVKVPQVDVIEEVQERFWLGAKEGAVQDREIPAQVVELHRFRIARKPVSNSKFCAFSGTNAPVIWRQNDIEHWYEIAINVAVELQSNEPVSSISQQQAQSFIAWVETVDGFEGAVLQYEYQSESSARNGRQEHTGRVRKWCPKLSYSYDNDQRPLVNDLATDSKNNDDYRTSSGTRLHTQPAIRCASYRTAAIIDRYLLPFSRYASVHTAG